VATPETKASVGETLVPELGPCGAGVMTKFVPRVVDPAVGFEAKFVVGTGAEGKDVGDRYCNGRVDVRVGPCKEARSDHTPTAGVWAGR